MSIAEQRLLEIWTASVKIWRQRMHIMDDGENMDEEGLSAHRISITPTRAPMPKICGYCHQEFLAIRLDRKYCSPRCQRQANHQKDAIRQRARAKLRMANG